MTRFVVLGAGAIGGTIGARLHQAGHDVTLIARGSHLEAIRRHGLTFIDPIGEATLRIPVAGDPSEVSWTDDAVVLLTTKTQDTVPALARLRSAVGGRDVPVVCVQNGVANERMALRRFHRVYGTVVVLPATHLRPGVVEAHTSPPGVLDTGRYPSGTDQIAEAITSALAASGFHAKPDPAVMRLKYAKLLGALANTVHAAVGLAGAGDVIEAAQAEAIQCYRAAAIDWAPDAEFQALRQTIAEAPGARATPPVGGSSWQSLARGTGSIEADYLNGEIVLLGALHQVATPVNRALQLLASVLIATRAEAGSMTAAELRGFVLG